MARKKKQGSYVEGGDPDGYKKKGSGSDGEIRKLKNDPHNPRNLLKRRKDLKADGYNQDGSNWKPTAWNDTGTGKGDAKRSMGISEEVYGYRYDLATGKITKEEFDKLMEGYTSNEMG
jgi:hypothetical protein